MTRIVSDFSQNVRHISLVLAAFYAAMQPTLAQQSSPLGVYAQTSTYCGDQPINRNAGTIPSFGCFLLDSGHSATGRFLGHTVKVRVNGAGQEEYEVDGTRIVDVKSAWPVTHRMHATNLPFVQPSSSGYAICEHDGHPCPTEIQVFSRNPDRSVLLMVSECLPPAYKRCVITRQNWDFEMSRHR